MIASDIIKLKLKKKNSQDIETLRSFTFIHKIESININDEQIFILSVDNASHNLPIILKYIDVESVEFTSTTLNDVFLGFTGRDLKEQPEGGFMERYAQYD
jgi:hypothetical protein